MTIDLVRVDDRLIHGQVVIGWGRPMGVGSIAVVDDTLAGSDWEQEIYRSAVPASIGIEFFGTSGAAERVADWAVDGVTRFIITGDLATAADLHRSFPVLLPRVNLGGIHHVDGRVERLPYLFLSTDETDLIRQMMERGAEVFAQDLPTTIPVGGPELIG